MTSVLIERQQQEPKNSKEKTPAENNPPIASSGEGEGSDYPRTPSDSCWLEESKAWPRKTLGGLVDRSEGRSWFRVLVVEANLKGEKGPDTKF
jgi:hypothetical protein